MSKKVELSADERAHLVLRFLQKMRVRDAALYQAARLFELLPQAPNELWQADVTYLHIAGCV